jgi:hypothetical protein
MIHMLLKCMICIEYSNGVSASKINHLLIYVYNSKNSPIIHKILITLYNIIINLLSIITCIIIPMVSIYTNPRPRLALAYVVLNKTKYIIIYLL